MSVAETDLELVAAFKAGDLDAFERLYQRHATPLLTILLHILGDRHAAEDELQETFVSFALNAACWDSASNLRAYLIAVARNRALNRRRTQMRTTNLNRRYEFLTRMREPEAGISSVEAAERLERLNDGLSRLPEAEREVILLHTQAELGFREIAEILDTPQGTVATRYRAALGRLREMLENER